MKQEFEKVERHLYRRRYETACGDWREAFYVRFVDWKKVRRTFPAGDNLDDARDELGRLHTLNKGRHDWDKEKQEREQAKAKAEAKTLAEWLDEYLKLMKDTPSHPTKKAQSAHLKRILGHLPLAEVTKVKILEYKQRRKQESLVRHGKPVKGTLVKGATVNREVSCLMAALNLASESKMFQGEPPVLKKKEREKETARKRILEPEEYQAILDASDRWLQRVIIAANEAALDQGVLLGLDWSSVKDGLIVVKRDKTDVCQVVGISPALAGVLDELRAEQRKVKAISGTNSRVFTRDGKPISKDALRYAFDGALKEARYKPKPKDGEEPSEEALAVVDFQFRDFRHCARTRWALNGLPFEIAETGLGHKLKGMAAIYTNLSHVHIKEAFQEMFKKIGNGVATGKQAAA
jgi:integrase